MSIKKYLKILKKFAKWVLISVSTALLILVISVSFSPTQTMVAKYGASYLSTKTNKEISLSYISIGIFSGINIKNIFIEDNKKDTLLSAENINIDINLFSAIFGDIEPDEVFLDNVVAKIKIDKDTIINFSYLIDAFADEENKKKKTEEEKQNNINLNLDNVKLNVNKTRFVFFSETAGINLDVNVGKLNLTTDTLNINNLSFSTKELFIKDAFISLNILKKSDNTEEDTTEITPIYLASKSLNFENIGFYLDYSIADLKLSATAKKGFIVPKQIDINKGKYFAKEAKIDGANVSIEFLDDLASLNNDTINDYGLITLVPDVGVEAGSKEIEITNSSFKLDYKNVPDTLKTFDSNHMYFKDLNLIAQNSEYLKDEMHAEIKSMSGSLENENIAINNLSANAILRNTKMQVSKLNASSKNSNIKGEFKITYNNFSELISDSIKFNTLELLLKESSVDIADINYFFNTDSVLNTDSVINKKIIINTILAGNSDSLDIKKLNLKLFDNSKLITSGKLKNLKDLKNLEYNFDLKTLNISKNEIALFSNEKIPDYINFIVLKGKISGKSKDVNAKLNVLNDFGEMDIDLSVKDSLYTANIDFINENFSAIFNDSIKLKNLYANLKIEGQGFDYETNKMELALQIDSTIYNNIKNTNISFNLKSEKGKYNAKINSKNKMFNMFSNIDFEVKDSTIYLQTTTNINNIDLKWLGFTQQKTLLKFGLTSTYQGAGINNLTSNIKIKDFSAEYKNKEYILNNLDCDINISDSITDVRINSDYIDGFVKANFNINEIKERFFSFTDDYFLKLDSVKTYNSQISFSLDINDDNLISRQVITDLSSLKTGIITGDFNSKNYEFNLDANINNFNYKSIVGDSITVDFYTENKQINYKIELNKVNLTDSFFVDNFIFSGIVNQDSISFEFNDLDKNYSKYYFGASMVKLDTISRLNLYPKLIIDSVLFTVNKDNYIEFGKNYLKFGEISIIHKNQKIYFKPSVENGDIDFLIENFDLNLLSKNNFSSHDLLYGDLNANGKINLNGNGNIIAKVNNFNILKEDIGTISIQTDFNQWKYDIKSQILGEGIDVDFKINNKSDFVLKSKINKLNLAIIKPLIKDYLTSLKGNLTGSLDLKYSKKILFTGNVHFDNIRAHSKLRNANIIIDNQSLKFSNEIVYFNNFTIKDTADNKFIMNGKLYDLDYNYFKADIELTAKNFTFYDVDKKRNKRFYGKIIIDNKAKINGDINKFNIISDTKFLKGTKITYVFPENELMSLEKSDGIVEFVTSTKDTLIEKDTIVDNWYKNVVMQSNIVVDKNTEINIIFNDIAGESISLVGGANINFDINEVGTINLNGDYIIEDGMYNLSYYEIVKRNFSLKKGSRIIWTGDPYNPIADIVASYKIKTNPYPLMVSEGSSETELNKYRTNQIFYVNLGIKGMMLYPEMFFNIEYPKMYGNSNDQALRSKINMINSDPEKANKQAISLLVISSFITDEGNIENGGETFVNNSVSNILTSQLNKYSNKFVKGVDFNFDVNRYSTYNNASANGDGAQTDVKIEVKKKMFNDRIIVEVAGGVSMESQTSNNENSSIHDAAIEYLITKDGRYKLRVFSEKDYSTMEQDVQSSGLSFIYTAEFDNLSELFGKNIDAKKEEQEPEKTEENYDD